jgi:hypothetical protein
LLYPRLQQSLAEERIGRSDAGQNEEIAAADRLDIFLQRLMVETLPHRQEAD